MYKFKITILFYFYLVTIISTQIYCQKHIERFDHLTTENGLSQNSITSIIQDKEGFLWVGTYNGLNRYDGYNFKIFRHSQTDTSSIADNYIRYIYQDSEYNTWIATDKGLSLFNPDNETFINYYHDSKNPNSLSDNCVFSILEDNQNRLWIGTYQDFDIFDKKNKIFKHNKINLGYSTKQRLLTLAMFEDSYNDLWIATNNGLYNYNHNNKRYTHYLSNSNKNSISSNEVTSICEDSKNLLWIGTKNGLNQFNRETHVFYRYKVEKTPSGMNNNIVSLFVDKWGDLWIGTEGEGLALYNPLENKFVFFKQNIENNQSISSNTTTAIYMDNQDILWIGTYAGGLNVFNKNQSKFKLYQHIVNDKNSLSQNLVTAFCESANGNIWIGTDGGGLNLLNKKTDKFETFKSDGTSYSLSSNKIFSIFESKNKNLWVGTYQGGLNKFNTTTQYTLQYKHKEGNISGLCENIITALYENDDYLWIGTYYRGLDILNKKEKTFINYLPDTKDKNAISNELITTIYRDKKNNLWIGTGLGLNHVVFESKNKKMNIHFEKIYFTKDHSDELISSIIEENNNLWIATEHSINLINENKTIIKRFCTTTHFPFESIASILADNSGNLWIANNHGITKFNPNTLRTKNFDVNDGIQSNEFRNSSALKTSNGEFYFGGTNGFNSFYPDSIKENTFIPPVVFVDFKLFGVTVKPDKQGSPLSKQINKTKKIILSYKQSSFSFDFAALNYTSTKKNKFKYMLKGYNNDWTIGSTERSAIYTHISPGNYEFMVKGSNNDEVWNENIKSVEIIIKPPFWLTGIAYLIYGILFLALSYLIYSWIKYKHELRIERIEHEKNMELEQMKLNFFTNVSHELRTPLTLIMAPLEQMMNKKEQLPECSYLIQVMNKNVKRLYNLVNELLDFRKIESGLLKLNTSKGDVVALLKEIISLSQPLANDKKIHLLFNSEFDSFNAIYDADKLNKIISNLILNALKYSIEFGKIEVQFLILKMDDVKESINTSKYSKDDRFITIKIIDTGIGIPKIHLDKIFNRFYQVDNTPYQQVGSGIGLAFVKELITLHNGQIHVESEELKGTTFTIFIPLLQINMEDEILLTPNINNNEKNKDEASKTYSEKTDDRFNILVIEDNSDLRNFLVNQLSIDYSVNEAENGNDGYISAIKNIPDLIISDILMPSMNGIELCKKIKTDERTSHIPIILLTARTDEEQIEEGLETGADDYVTKPFNMRLLNTRIKNLIESRNKLRSRFSKELRLQPTDITITSTDEKFLKRAITLIEDHISDSDFDNEAFKTGMGMSHAQIYRKIRALTDQSVSEFIRIIRLKRAAQLLEQSQLSVSEISYEVGFKDPSIFSRYFKEYFGKTPTEYSKQFIK